MQWFIDTNKLKTESLLDSQMRSAKHHQKDILHEIGNIKGELDNLIQL